jgi:hypothetical protein
LRASPRSALELSFLRARRNALEIIDQLGIWIDPLRAACGSRLSQSGGFQFARN